MKITLEAHPAKRHDGKPLFEHARGVRADGTLVAYVEVDKPGRPLNFIGTFEIDVAAVKAEVEKLLGHVVGDVGVPPKGTLGKPADEDDDDEG